MENRKTGNHELSIILVTRLKISTGVCKNSLFFFLRKKRFVHVFFFGCGESSLLCAGCLQPQWVSRVCVSSCGAQASRCSGFSCCRAWALRSCSVWAQQLWHRRLPHALQHVESSWTRDRTGVP